MEDPPDEDDFEEEDLEVDLDEDAAFLVIMFDVEIGNQKRVLGVRWEVQSDSRVLKSYIEG